MRFFMIDDINTIDLDRLLETLPGRLSWWNPMNLPGLSRLTTRGRYTVAMLRSHDILQDYGINTPQRLAHFIGQGLIETGFLRYTEENLNYSATALRRVFGKYFKSDEEALAYARQPKKIANRVYGNRMGNGDEASGDGWRYRGRGFFQLTGRNNYEIYSEASGVDIVKSPDLISKDLRKSIHVAAAFWQKNNLGLYADENDMKKVSRGINFGNPEVGRKAHGEDERIEWTKRVMGLLDDPIRVQVDAQSFDELEVGDRGPEVKALQEKLALLDYAVGKPDGIFGKNTRRAVVMFQFEADLEPTGVVDAATDRAIDEELIDTRQNKFAIA